MTESEKTKKAIYSLGFIKGILYNGIFADRIDCIDYAISTLEEILEYRRIGSLNECRDAMEFWKTRQELDAKIEKCMEYEKIGTVEECREAREKQEPKKKIYPQTALEKYYHAPQCPNCKRELTAKICGYTLEQAIGIYSNCPWCGQAINKTVEGMEDEEN